ncbi:MAG: rod shape-determining protein RodA [Verrucomicrobia bacterium]|nr:rod shape-determining protein RodA [Verrucomicrobiota bacterium]
MTPYLHKLFRFNWVLLALILALCAFGVVAIYCATFMRENKYLLVSYRRQIQWMGISLVVFFVTSLTDYRWVRWGALPTYILGVALLVLTHFKGKKVFGAKSWLEFGGFSLQPSQLAILGGIMVFALLITEFKRMHPMLKLILFGVIAAPPALLVALQPQLGGVLVWGPVALTMLFVGGIPVRYLLSIILTGVAVVPLGIFFGLKEFQRARILSFLDPEADPLGTGWNIIQSLTAVGNGGWSGRGFKAHNTVVEQGLLPTTIAHTDFIFAVTGEAFGFVGNAAVLVAFAFLLVTGLYIAYQARDQLGLVLVTGVMSLIFTHVFMNTGMTVQLVPIAGLPLPFISYGGTFLIIMLFAMGIVQSVWIHRKELR